MLDAHRQYTVEMRINASDCAFAAGAATALTSRTVRRLQPSRILRFTPPVNQVIRARRRVRSLCTNLGSCSSASVLAAHASLENATLPKATEDHGEGSVKEFSVSADERHMRLDKVLTARFTRSRSYFHALIDASLVSINGSTKGVCKKRILSEGDTVRITFTTPERERPLQPEDIPLVVLYEDEHLAVLNKPAGLVVHPAPGNWTGTLANGLAHHYTELATDGVTAVERPGIVHRLDKGTSGALVIARTRAAHEGLQELFAAREVRKEYLAVTLGSPGGAGVGAGVIDAPLGRSRTDRVRMAVVAEEDGGRKARSLFEVLGSDARGLLHVVRVFIETGRTHQIRVHMRYRRAPVLGDNLYGAPDLNRRFKSAAQRPMLHAQRIAFKHPITGEDIDVQARLPEDFRSLVAKSIDPALLQMYPEW